MSAEEELTPEELAFKKKYGRLPPKKKPAKTAAIERLHGGDRKYFDSADHAMNSAGMQAENGKVIATAANIPRRSHARPSSMVDHTKDIISAEDGDANTAAPANPGSAETAPAATESTAPVTTEN